MDRSLGRNSDDRDGGQAGGDVILSVQIIHASPGRLRLRLRRADLESAALHTVEETLRTVPGVEEVRKNPLTRSLVITYDPDEVVPDDLFTVVARAGVLIVPTEFEVEVNLESQPVAHSIVKFFSTFDERVSERANGQIDLRTLVPFGLAALGAREILARRIVPVPWYALFWYSFDAFLKLRKSGPPTSPPKG